MKLIIYSHVSLYVCPSVRVEQLDSNWTDFYDVRKFEGPFMLFFRKSVEKIQFSLKSDNNNRYFT